MNFTYTGDDDIVRLNIDELFAHNKQEHDASFVRPDVFFGEEEAKVVDPALLTQFIAGQDPASDVLTKDDIMTYQQGRIQDSLTSYPEAFFAEGQTTSFSAQATLLLAFGQDSQLEFVNKARLQEFLEFERFPDGYIPTENTEDYVDVIAEGSLANDVRLEFAASFQETALGGATSASSSIPAKKVVAVVGVVISFLICVFV